MTVEGGQRRPKGRPRSAGNVTCARCQELTPKTTTKYRFPEGLICGRCYDRAVHTFGKCPICSTDRLLPGIDSAGRSTCSDCSGLGRDFFCKRCGKEGAIFRRGNCERCSLDDDLSEILSGAEQVVPALSALKQRLLESDRPTSVLTWLRSSKVKNLLHGLADRSIEISHEGLDGAGRTAEVRHVRALLVDLHVLPVRDEAYAAFESWVNRVVDEASPSQRLPLTQYAVWHHLNRVRHLVERGEDAHSPAHYAKQQITAAKEFLEWLDEQQIALANCGQGLVDEWLTTGPTTRYNLKLFLDYCTEHKLSRPLTVPRRNARSTRRMDADERLRWIRFYCEATELKIATRTAALMFLLYGQPLSRLARMRVNQFTRKADGELMVRFSGKDVPVPEPFATIVSAHLAARARVRTQRVDDNPYLFPGIRAGRHITAQQLKEELNALGVDVLAAKNTSLDDLVTRMPAPLVAMALGFSFNAMTNTRSIRVCASKNMSTGDSTMRRSPRDAGVAAGVGPAGGQSHAGHSPASTLSGGDAHEDG